ncbi:MAG: hypothetical protein QXS41_02235 [Candidatus Woesearchaeota archaeon]
MRFNKRGAELSLNVIILAALGILVLLILVAVFSGQLGKSNQKISDTTEGMKKLNSLIASYPDDYKKIRNAILTKYGSGYTIDLATTGSELNNLNKFFKESLFPNADYPKNKLIDVLLYDGFYFCAEGNEITTSASKQGIGCYSYKADFLTEAAKIQNNLNVLAKCFKLDTNTNIKIKYSGSGQETANLYICSKELVGQLIFPSS